MPKAFEKHLRGVRLRCSINVLLEQIWRVLTIAGAVAVLVVSVERLLALEVVSSLTLWTFAGFAAGWVVLLWALKQLSRMEVSLLIDERLRLQLAG